MSTPDNPEGAEKGGRHAADDLLAAALAVGNSVQAAAKKAGVSEATAHRRLRVPSFRRRVAELRGHVLDQALNLASGGLVDAVARMREICRNGGSEAIQLAAAEKLVNAVLSIREHATNEEQLAALEEMVQKKKRKGKK